MLELTLDEALAMVERGEIADGKTVLLLQWAALRQVTSRSRRLNVASPRPPGTRTGRRGCRPLR